MSKPDRDMTLGLQSCLLPIFARYRLKRASCARICLCTNLINTSQSSDSVSDARGIPSDTESRSAMESKMTLLSCLVAVSMWLPVTIGQNYGVQQSYPSYSPPYASPSYASPQYSPPPYPAPQYAPPTYDPPHVYDKPEYHETAETNVKYYEANNTRRCGVQPTVHRHGLPKDRVTFGEYPWVVAVLDTYNSYKASGVLITPRHVLTAANGVSGYNAADLVVRVGDYDLLTDRNYLEVYKNYEVPVCKKHFYYSVPEYGYKKDSQYGYSTDQKQDYYQAQDTYDVVILELSEDVDMDQYPQVEPICLPEFYYKSASVYKEYYEGYGQVVQSSGNAQQQVNKEGSADGLDCWVVGYSYSPTEEFKYQTEKTTYNAETYTAPAPPPSYGYGYTPANYYPQTYTKYVPAYSYESYEEYSLTPRRAKVHKVYEDSYKPSYSPPTQSYGYGYPAPAPAPPSYEPSYEHWEADYYYDTCRADVGSAIMCKVPGRYEEEDPGKPYEKYVKYYENSYKPPAYTPPSYDYPPAPAPYYSPPDYKPYQPAYQAPTYGYRGKREASSYSQPPNYNPPSYSSYPAPAYSAPSYSAPTYPAPSYSAPAPTYNTYPLNYEEAKNRESRRFAVYGVVEYPTLCSSDAYEPKKLKVTPIEKILPWILNVIHTDQAQCYSNPAYASPPPYSPPYEPAYTPNPPPYSPPYEPAAPTYYTPQPPAYNPPYEPAAPTYYPPRYNPPYEAPSYPSPPTYSTPYEPPSYYSPPSYGPAP